MATFDVGYFLNNFDVLEAKKVLAAHYHCPAHTNAIHSAVSRDVKQRQPLSTKRVTCRTVAEEILYTHGLTRIEKQPVIVLDDIGRPIGGKGLEKYFTPDRTNHVDLEIVRRLKEGEEGHFGREERRCRSVLSKRCAGISTDHRNVPKQEAVLMLAIERRCKRLGKPWYEVVREMFCVHFGIRDINRQTEIKVYCEVV